MSFPHFQISSFFPFFICSFLFSLRELKQSAPLIPFAIFSSFPPKPNRSPPFPPPFSLLPDFDQCPPSSPFFLSMKSFEIHSQALTWLDFFPERFCVCRTSLSNDGEIPLLPLPPPMPITSSDEIPPLPSVAHHDWSISFFSLLPRSSKIAQSGYPL